MSKLESGKAAPKFKLEDQNGKLTSLNEYKGKKGLILYFYPKALTPGCTVQAQGLRDVYSKLKRKGYEVLAVSCDPTDKLARFADKHDLPFKLLSDIDKEVVNKYGKITDIMDKVKTKSHHEDVLKIIADRL